MKLFLFFVIVSCFFMQGIAQDITPEEIKPGEVKKEELKPEEVKKEEPKPEEVKEPEVLEIKAIGIGKPPEKAENPGQARAMAVRAAQLDAQRNLLAKIQNIPPEAIPFSEKHIQGILLGFTYGAPVRNEDGSSQIEILLSVNNLLQNYAALTMNLANVEKNFEAEKQKLLDSQTELQRIISEKNQALQAAYEKEKELNNMVLKLEIEVAAKTQNITQVENELAFEKEESKSTLQSLEAQCQEQIRILEETQKELAIAKQEAQAKTFSLENSPAETTEKLEQEKAKVKILTEQNELANSRHQKMMDLVAQIFSRNQELTKELDAKQEFNKNLEIKLAQREMELQTAKQGKEEAVAKYNQIWEAHYKKVQEHNKTKTTETKNTSQERSHIKNTLDTMETMISKIDSMILKILIEQKQFKKDMQSIKKVMNIAEEKIEESDEWRD